LKRTTPLWIALAALLAVPAFAAESKKTAPAEAKASKPAAAVEKAAEAPKATEPGKAEAPKEAAEAAPAKESGASHKSVAVAEILAFVPGIAVHGAGHMYAGSWMKGTGLLAIEGVSVWLGVRYGTELADDIGTVTKSSSGSVPSDFGPVYSRLGILLVATSAFLYTWFDDMAGASTAVGVYNKKADEAKSGMTGFRLAPNGDGLVVAYQRQF
jgi:hypothetical protein